MENYLQIMANQFAENMTYDLNRKKSLFCLVLLCIFIIFLTQLKHSKINNNNVFGTVLSSCNYNKCNEKLNLEKIISNQKIFTNNDILVLNTSLKWSEDEKILDIGHHSIGEIVVKDISGKAKLSIFTSEQIESRQNKFAGRRYFKLLPGENLIFNIKFGMPVSVFPTIQSTEYVFETEFKDMLINTIFISGILIVGTLSRTVQINTQIFSYFSLSISMAITLLSASGMWSKILWTHTEINTFLLAFSHSATPWIIIDFYRNYFFSKNKTPEIYRYLSLARLLFLICFPVFYFDKFLAAYFISGCALFFACVCLIGIGKYWKNFDYSERTYGIGIAFFMFFSLLYAINFSGIMIFSSSPYIFLSFGMFAESIFLSLSLNIRGRMNEIKLFQLSEDNSEKTKQILELASTSFDTYIETSTDFLILNVEGNQFLNLEKSAGSNFFDILAHNKEPLRDILENAAQNGTIKGLKLEIENSSGESIFLILNGHRFENAAGEMHWKFALMDRTAQAQAELHSLRSANLAELGRLSGSITHEINNPLTSIRIYCDNMLEELQDSKECAKSFKAPLESMSLMIDRVSDTVKSVRALYRSGVNLDFETFEVKAVLEGATQTLSTQIQNSKTKIEITGTALNENIAGDLRLLTQIFSNLIKNSIDAMENCPVKEINISADADANLLRIHLEDSGTGVPAHAVSKLFDPFYTTKGGSAGSGLGLALCQTIATKHKGVIQYLSDKGGAHFVFEMPIRQNSEP